jgi:methylmalonyl-CoA mutase cobalamin-binding domain/chain
MTDFLALKESFAALLLDDDGEAPASWARETLEDGVTALDFFQKVFTPAMVEVGDKFGRLDIFLPELIEAAERAKAVSEEVIKPTLAEEQSKVSTSHGTVLICSVQGDLHDIGKNMVALMLQVNGFDVIDIGIDVPPREIVERAQEVEADIVALSSLMTTSMPYMKETVELRDGFGLKDQFKIIVGGAPITPEYSAQIGADGFGKDAAQSVAECMALMNRARS